MIKYIVLQECVHVYKYDPKTGEYVCQLCKERRVAVLR
jgi:hypothetical protein